MRQVSLLLVSVMVVGCACPPAQPNSPPAPKPPYALGVDPGSTNLGTTGELTVYIGYPSVSAPMVERLEASLRLDDELGQPVSFNTKFVPLGEYSLVPELHVLPVVLSGGWLTLSIPWSSDWTVSTSRLEAGLKSDPAGQRWFFSYLPGESRPGVVAVKLSNHPLGYAYVHFSEWVAAPVPFHAAVQALGAAGQVLTCSTPLGADGNVNMEFALDCSDRVAALDFTKAIVSVAVGEPTGVDAGVPLVGAPGPLGFRHWNHVVDHNGDDVYENPVTTW